VRRQDDRHAVVVAQPAQVLEQVPRRARIEARARLVEQQHRRPRQEALRELRAAREAARQALDELVLPVGDPEAIEQLGDPRLQPGAARP
jgi:hypothetical protein